MPQPFHRGFAERSPIGELPGHGFGMSLASVIFAMSTLPAAEIEGDFAQVRVRDAREGCVRSLAERGVDRFRRHLPKGQDIRRGRCAAWISVATGAMLFEHDSAFRGLGVRRACGPEHCNQDSQNPSEVVSFEISPEPNILSCNSSCVTIYARLLPHTMFRQRTGYQFSVFMGHNANQRFQFSIWRIQDRTWREHEAPNKIPGSSRPCAFPRGILLWGDAFPEP